VSLHFHPGDHANDQTAVDRILEQTKKEALIKRMGEQAWNELNIETQTSLLQVLHGKCAMHVGVNISKYFSKGFASHWPEGGGPTDLPPSAEVRMIRRAETGE
jgi:hypothetical protein